MKNDKLYLYGYVGSWDFSSEKVREFLQYRRTDEKNGVDVYIYSFGGSLVEGYAIRSLLSSVKDVNFYIVGYAASSATFVTTLKGAKVYGVNPFMYMIHNPMWNEPVNADNADEVKKIVNMMRDTYIEHYVKKTGQDEKIVKKWMSEEKVFDAAGALEAGFVDGIVDSLQDVKPDEMQDFNISDEMLTAMAADVKSGKADIPADENFRKKMVAFIDKKPNIKTVSGNNNKTSKNMKNLASLAALLAFSPIITDGKIDETQTSAEIEKHVKSLQANFKAEQAKTADLEKNVKSLQAKLDEAGKNLQNAEIEKIVNGITAEFKANGYEFSDEVTAKIREKIVASVKIDDTEVRNAYIDGVKNFAKASAVKTDKDDGIGSSIFDDVKDRFKGDVKNDASSYENMLTAEAKKYLKENPNVSMAQAISAVRSRM